MYAENAPLVIREATVRLAVRDTAVAVRTAQCKVTVSIGMAELQPDDVSTRCSDAPTPPYRVSTTAVAKVQSG